MHLAWMAWTWATAGFFIAIALMLVVMSILALRHREVPCRGIFRFPTTRGDRLFIGLLGTAYIFIAWIRLTGGDTLWLPSAAGVVFIALMLRFA